MSIFVWYKYYIVLGDTKQNCDSLPVFKTIVTSENQWNTFLRFIISVENARLLIVIISDLSALIAWRSSFLYVKLNEYIINEVSSRSRSTVSHTINQTLEN